MSTGKSNNESSVWSPPDERPWGWILVGLVFTLIQGVLIAIACAISWGRPRILDDISSDSVGTVIACLSILLIINITFCYFTEKLALRRARTKNDSYLSSEIDRIDKPLKSYKEALSLANALLQKIEKAVVVDPTGNIQEQDYKMPVVDTKKAQAGNPTSTQVEKS